MTRIGFHASHEQFAPGRLLELAVRAEASGFDAVMCSDHFHPWSHAQGQSGHAWTWLGAAMSKTGCPYGVVNAPVGRYHPAIIAQAAATLEAMFPGRFWLAVGSGEALNERIVGGTWPGKPERNRRLLEAVDVMRALWRGECVDHQGAFQVEQAQLFTRPEKPPSIFVAALSEATAQWGAPWADGLITVSQSPEKLQPIVDAFRNNGGANKPVYLQIKLSYASDEGMALRGAHEQWATNVLDPALSQDISTPQAYEALAKQVTPEQVAEIVHVSADTQQHVRWLQTYIDMGFDALYLHNVNTWQEAFVDTFSHEVIPYLKRR